MKHSKKKPSLLTGLTMIIFGIGGIGYIPGKTMLLTVVFILVLAGGILITASYIRKNKSSQRQSAIHSIRPEGRKEII